MDSRLHGVPLSATPVVPKAAAPSYNAPAAASSGIRAPLTVDESDFEYSSRRNSFTSSYGSGDSEGFVSGEEGDYELDVTEQDVGVLGETPFIKQNLVLGQQSSSENAHTSYRKNPGEAFAQESGIVSRSPVARPVVRGSDEIGIKVVRNVDDSDYTRSFLSESGDKVGVDGHYVLSNGSYVPPVAVTDEEVSESEAMPVDDVNGPLVENLRIPIAKISVDSDDDSQNSEVSEDDFSGIGRVPSVEILHRIDSTPKSRLSKVIEGDAHGLQAKNVVDLEFVEEMETRDHDLGSNDEREHADVDDCPVDHVITADLMQEKEVKVDSLCMGEDHNSKLEQEHNEIDMHLGEEIREIDVIRDLSKCADLINQRELTDLGSNSSVASTADYLCGTVEPMQPEVTKLGCRSNATGSASVDGNHCLKFEMEENEDLKNLNEEIREMDVIGYQREHVDLIDQKESTAVGITSFAPSAEEPGCLCGTVKLMEPEVSESGCISKFVAASTADGDQKTISEGNIAFNQNMLSNEVENESERDVGSVHFCIDLKEVSANCCFQISELSEALYQSNAGRFVFQGKLDKETKEADKISEQFSLESNSSDMSSLCLSARSNAEARSPNRFETSSPNCEFVEALSEAEMQQLEKIHQIRVKYLWLLHWLGSSPDDSIASKVLYELTCAEERISPRACHLDSAKKAAMELEAQKKDDLDVSMSILVIGKTGVGKSSTINSIFGEKKTTIDAFEPATACMEEVIGMKDGVKLKVIDTPGLRSYLKDQSTNRKVLSSIKRLMQKSPPDVILYVDRLDTQTSDLSDLPLLKSVTSYLGSSMWQKAILVLTHAASMPPDGPNGYPLSYEACVAQRSLVVQQLISHSVGEFLMTNASYMIPINLVENHPIDEKIGYGEKLMQHAESWRVQLLLLCYSMKTLSEVISVVTIQNPARKMNSSPIHSPPRSYFWPLSFQPYAHPKLSSDQSRESFNSDSVLGFSSSSDQDDTGCDDLPPFKPLKETQITKLSRDEATAYFQEYHDLVNLLQKKQLTGEMSRFRDRIEGEALPLRDLALLQSFDKDNPSCRYPFWEPASQLLTQPIFTAFLIENEVLGLKIEDRIAVGNGLTLVGNGGFIASQDNTAYGTNVELCRTVKDYPIPLHEVSLGLSVTSCRGDLICGSNLCSQFYVGASSKLNVKAGLNNKLSGQISVKTSSSDQLHIAALAVFPVAKAIFKRVFLRSPHKSST